MDQKQEQIAEIRKHMKERGLYTTLDEQCESSRKEYEKILEVIDPSYREIIEKYVELINRCNFQHICDVYFLGREDGKENV